MLGEYFASYKLIQQTYYEERKWAAKHTLEGHMQHAG
jgi:hypothetical protein